MATVYISIVIAQLFLTASIVQSWPCPSLSSDPSEALAGSFLDTPVASSTFSLCGRDDDDRKTCSDGCASHDDASYWALEKQGASGVCKYYGESSCSNNNFLGLGASAAQSSQVAGSCGHGGVEGDPHFSGGDNSRFDFSGRPKTTYCMLSDSHIHMNMYLDGYYGKYEERESKPMTWIRKLGILWGHHTLVFEARQGVESDYLDGYMHHMAADDKSFTIEKNGIVNLFGGEVQIEWNGVKVRSRDDFVDEYEVRIQDLAWMRLTLRPEVANLRTHDDGLVHFEVKLLKGRLTKNAHGILGQTYRPDHMGRFQKQKLVHNKAMGRSIVPGDNAEGFLDGSAEDYVNTELLTADCSVSRFSRASTVDREASLGMELTSETA